MTISDYTLSQGTVHQYAGREYVAIGMRDGLGTLITSWEFVESQRADEIADAINAPGSDAPYNDETARALLRSHIRIAKRDGLHIRSDVILFHDRSKKI